MWFSLFSWITFFLEFDTTTLSYHLLNVNTINMLFHQMMIDAETNSFIDSFMSQIGRQIYWYFCGLIQISEFIFDLESWKYCSHVFFSVHSMWKIPKKVVKVISHIALGDPCKNWVHWPRFGIQNLGQCTQFLQRSPSAICHITCTTFLSRCSSFSITFHVQGCLQAIAHSDCAIYSNMMCYLLFQNYCRIVVIWVQCALSTLKNQCLALSALRKLLSTLQFRDTPG